MAYYYGYFRSNDTSIDPKGQLFKIAISTNVHADTPYKYVPQQVGNKIQLVPDAGTEITLSSTPFTVQYDGDDNNIYKPYKCSTATIGVVNESFNADFAKCKRCDTFVRLLKWRNDVVAVSDHNGIYKYTDSAGKTLAVKYNIIGNGGLGVHSVFNDFRPQDVDENCYTTEWAGYITPNSYNQPFSNYLDEYEIECQDVLSCLRYYTINDIENNTYKLSFDDILNATKYVLPYAPAIKNIFKTTAIKTAGHEDLTQHLYTLLDNWKDESDNYTDLLTVVGECMKFLNTTAVQIKDDIYITNADAIATERQNYTYIQNGEVKHHTPHNNVIDLTTAKSADNNTSLSLLSTYKKVELESDLYFYDKLIMPINNDDYLDEVVNWDYVTTYTTVNGSTRHVLDDTDPYTYDYGEQGKCIYAGRILTPKDGIDEYKITCFHGNADRTEMVADAPDYVYWNSANIEGSVTTRNELTTKNGSCIIEYDIANISSDSPTATYMKTYSGKRSLMIHTPAPYKESHSGICPYQLPLSYITNANQNQYRMLTIESKKAFITCKHALQINGDITFYQTRIPTDAGWGNEDILKAYLPYMYMWTKVQIIGDDGSIYYLQNGSNYTYYWAENTSGNENSSLWVKIWYNGNSAKDKKQNKRNRLNTESAAFENTFSFNKNNRGSDGTCVQMPNANIYGRVKIDFSHPFGCATEKKVTNVALKLYQPQYTIIDNFEVNIINADALHFMYDDSQWESNNKSVAEITNDATDDYTNMQMMLSSNDTKNASKTVVIDEDNNIIKYVYNSALDINYNSECNYVGSITKAYQNQALKISTSIHDDVTPLHKIKYTSQFQEREFIVNDMAIDYKNNIKSINVVQICHNCKVGDIYIYNTAKNNRRNGDNLYNQLPFKAKAKAEQQTEDLNAAQYAQFYRDSRNGNVILYDTDVVNDFLEKSAMIDADLKNGTLTLYAPINAVVTAEIINNDLVLKTDGNV